MNERLKEAGGHMTADQLDRAALLAESRHIDAATAQELVYLRDRVVSSTRPASAEPSLAKAGVSFVPPAEDALHIAICSNGVEIKRSRR